MGPEWGDIISGSTSRFGWDMTNITGLQYVTFKSSLDNLEYVELGDTLKLLGFDSTEVWYDTLYNFSTMSYDSLRYKIECHDANGVVTQTYIWKSLGTD